MTWSRLRRARKQHRCATSGCTIQPGDEYAEHVAAPDHVGNQGWWRLRECLPCAIMRRSQAYVHGLRAS